jgi:hypothetical protein
MSHINLITNGDGAFADLKENMESLVSVPADSPINVALLDRGMASGRPSVAIRLDLPDGKSVIAQTSARLFVTTARAIMARYPDLFEDEATNAERVH